MAAAQQVLLPPDLIVAECANVAWRRVRDGQVPIGQAEAFLKALPAWFERLTPSTRLHEAAFRVARRLNHPVYDCLYIALAAHVATPLVTADAALARRGFEARRGTISWSFSARSHGRRTPEHRSSGNGDQGASA